MVHLLAPILSNPGVPSLSGSVEVDIIVEDMPAGSGPRQNATLGKSVLSYLLTIICNNMVPCL